MERFINHIRAYFDKPDILELSAYQHKIPQSITVESSYDKKSGYYTAKIIQVDNNAVRGLIITESKTPEGLVDMVNDALLTYLEVPERIKLALPLKLLPVDIDFAEQVVKNGQFVLAK